MSIVRFVVEVDIDDELLAEHDGKNEAPPNDIKKWYGLDLITAVQRGLAEVVHEPLEMMP